MVPKRSKILVIVFASVFLLFISLGILVSFFGPRFVEGQIENSLNTPATLGGVSLGFPLSITLKDIRVGSILRAEMISLSPSLLGLFSGRIVINRLLIVKPVINIEQYPDGALNLPKPAKAKGKAPQVLLASLLVKDGMFIFTDRKVTAEVYKIIAEHINLDVSKASLSPASLKIKIKASAELADPQGRKLGAVSASGWIDPIAQNMDGNLQIKELDAVYFSPYYGNLISQRKLLSAKVNLKADLKAKDNDLNAQCHLELFDLVYAQPKAEEAAANLQLMEKTLDLFIDEQGRLKLDFSLNTKFDNPKLTSSEIRNIILQAAIKNIASQPPEKIIEKAADTIKMFKDFGKEMKDIFK
ncbi:MAG: DUF748 domain-containing protein [Candidatus Omnitrophota bacterium]